MNLLDFANHEYINLITYKKDNTSVKTPVWVAEHDDYLVITSSKSAGKVKRINNNGRATIYVTDQIGSSALSEPLDVRASIIDDEENKQAIFPVYIVHMPVQMGVMYIFSDINLPFLIKFPLVLFLLCFLSLTIYHGVKNIKFLRPLFGLPNKK